MEKRAVLAVVLSLLVLLGYQYIFAPKEQMVAEKPASISGTHSMPAGPAITQTPDLEHPKEEGATHPSLPQGEGLAAKDIVVETDTIRVVLNTKSASVKSWMLKRYKDKVNGAVSVELVPPGKRQLELLSTENGSHFPDNLIYISDKESLNGAGSITFTAMRPDGTKVRKTFTFTENSYKAGLKVSYENTGSSVTTERPALSMSITSKLADRGVLFHEMAFLSGKDLKRIHADKIKDEKAGSGEIEWAYLGDKYFITAVMPTSGGNAEVYFKKVGEELFEASLFFVPLQIKPGETKGMEYGLYFGPKEVEILKAAGSKLERAIDLGFFDLIAYPMLLSFKWMYEIIPNYGVVVILLTVLIKVPVLALIPEELQVDERHAEDRPIDGTDQGEIQGRQREVEQGGHGFVQEAQGKPSWRLSPHDTSDTCILCPVCCPWRRCGTQARTIHFLDYGPFCKGTHIMLRLSSWELPCLYSRR